MPSYTVKLPNGESYTVSGDNDDEVMAQIGSLTGETTVVGKPQTAPMAAQRGAPTSEQARARAKEFAISSIPTVAAGAASLATGPAAPLTATALSAAFGGFLGKGLEMGLRTGTGIGAETVPPTLGGRLMAGAQEGLEQGTFEVGAGIAAKLAGAAARATIAHSQRSQFAKALRHEAKLKARMEGERAAYETALSRNDAEIERLEKAIDDIGREQGVAGSNVRLGAQAKLDALEAKKLYLQREAVEEAFRVSKIEAASASVDRALAVTGAGVPEMGARAAVMADKLTPLVYHFERDSIESIGAAYVGLEEAAMQAVPGRIDTRPLFKKTVDRIKKIPRLEGPGRNFTEINENLAKLEKDYEEFGKAKPDTVVKAGKGELDPLSLKAKPDEVVPGGPSVAERESLAGLIVFQGNISQELAKVQALGPSGERTARVLRQLNEDTGKFIEQKMLEAGWKEGPGMLKAVQNQWYSTSSFMEQQAFQLLKKDPSRAHELLTAEANYTPVLKKVLKDTGAYEAMWPEIRRRWIESSFIKNGRLDFAAVTETARANQSILREIFDTPESMAQWRRIQLPAARLEALKGKSLRSVADRAKYEALAGEIQKVSEQMAAIDDQVAKDVEQIFAAGKDKQQAFREKLAEARGYHRDRLKEAYEKRNAEFAAQLQEMGLLKPGVSRDIFGPVPRILMYRGAAGLVGGGLAGAIAGGGVGGLAGAAGALAGGWALNKADQVLVQRLLFLAEDPAAMGRVMKAIDNFERGVAMSGPAFRASLLGGNAYGVARDVALAPAHEQRR